MDVSPGVTPGVSDDDLASAMNAVLTGDVMAAIILHKNHKARHDALAGIFVGSEERQRALARALARDLCLAYDMVQAVGKIPETKIRSSTKTIEYVGKTALLMSTLFLVPAAFRKDFFESAVAMGYVEYPCCPQTIYDASLEFFGMANAMIMWNARPELLVSAGPFAEELTRLYTGLRQDHRDTLKYVDVFSGEKRNTFYPNYDDEFFPEILSVKFDGNSRVDRLLRAHAWIHGGCVGDRPILQPGDLGHISIESARIFAKHYRNIEDDGLWEDMSEFEDGFGGPDENEEEVVADVMADASGVILDMMQRWGLLAGGKKVETRMD